VFFFVSFFPFFVICFSFFFVVLQFTRITKPKTAIQISRKVMRKEKCNEKSNDNRSPLLQRGFVRTFAKGCQSFESLKP